jgi:hypothetical protein
MEIELIPRQTYGSTVIKTAFGWKLEIPFGTRQAYRLAQLDDYSNMSRIGFLHVPPWSLRLRARISGNNLPGTWGFGLWNDPFGFSLGHGAKRGQLPALPQTAWFMHASTPNWLSIRNNSSLSLNKIIPGNGFFAGTFRSLQIPSFFFAPAMLALPLFDIRPISRILRRLASQIIRQDAVVIHTDVTQWHEYSINWLAEGCMFTLDGHEILSTSNSPRPPLGLVIWVDNQFAAWTPEGRFGYGTLENPSTWLEIEKLNFQHEIE